MKNNTSGTWDITRRPLTYNMNELASVAGYPGDQFLTAPFDRASDYLKSLAREHLIHLQTQRNLADDAEIARHRLSIPFCDDMRPSNMLIDLETLQITTILDFEFTNAMPAKFTYDPPWWLLLSGPEVWLKCCVMDEFLALYKPRIEQFLRALEKVESEKVLEVEQPVGLSLSARIRDLWRTGRFWFDYAARKSFDVDVIYWAALHKDSAGIEMLDDKVRTEMEPFTKIKMEQLKAYKEECTARFSSNN
ncbi:uncharacterized protein BJX67DRAFT_380644 [Aspergillus lucknowensis]|uniref:Aminoglycoside phosphotransferase domain-containing protein n=1 Tax=Aspergillus lucknowensis TaxID=176173 RepID=A0ABR4LT26_9EURO